MTMRWILLLLLLILGSGSLVSYSQTPSPVVIVAKLDQAYQGIQDYQCRMVEWCRQGSSRESRVINFYFKKPRLIRMDIRRGSRPFDSGSVGVFSGGSTVIGHRGGLLSGIVLKLNKKNSLATTIRGVSFDESDLQATLEKLQAYLKSGSITLTMERLGQQQCYRLRCRANDPALFGGLTEEIIWLNSLGWLPRAADSYQGQLLVQQVSWSDYILNAGLPGELFQIDYNPERLVTAGIPSVHQLPLPQEGDSAHEKL